MSAEASRLCETLRSGNCPSRLYQRVTCGRVGASCATAQVLKCLCEIADPEIRSIVSRVLTVLDSERTVIQGGRLRRTRTAVGDICQRNLWQGSQDFTDTNKSRTSSFGRGRRVVTLRRRLLPRGFVVTGCVGVGTRFGFVHFFWAMLLLQ